MSHHLDSPTPSSDPRLDISDLYVFDGVEGTVLVMAVDGSLADASRSRGFHRQARYEFRIHFDGERTERLVYRISFIDRGPDTSLPQGWRLDRLEGDAASNDRIDGTVLATGRTGGSAEGRGGIRAWTGASADPFFLDLALWTHVVDALQHRHPFDLRGWHRGQARNSFAGSQVEGIVVEVPYATDSDLPTGRHIGVWARTVLATEAGGWQQANRAAVPMVWPLLRAFGSEDDREQCRRRLRAHPADDPQHDSEAFARMIAAVVRSSGVGDPEAYARTVAKRLLPDILPYAVGTPAAFSFAGFNGRRLSDNAAEVMFGLVTNSAVPTGLSAPADRQTWQHSFPYLLPVLP